MAESDGMAQIGAGEGGEIKIKVSDGVLHASMSSNVDVDGDGLTDSFEVEVLGTSLNNPDSDGDGFSDPEEFARGSNPRDTHDVPLPSASSINISASGEMRGVDLIIGVHLQEGDFLDKDIQIGLFHRGYFRTLNGLYETPGLTFEITPDHSGRGVVGLFTVPFDNRLVDILGNLSVFTLLSSGDHPTIVGAGVVDLASIDGVVGIIGEASADRADGAQIEATHWGYGQGGGGGANDGSIPGTIYTPLLTGDGDLPTNWTPDETCFQATETISFDDGAIHREVVGAGCISGGGGCPGSCSRASGDTFQTFDPQGMIGG